MSFHSIFITHIQELLEVTLQPSASPPPHHQKCLKSNIEAYFKLNHACNAFAICLCILSLSCGTSCHSFLPGVLSNIFLKEATKQSLQKSTKTQCFYCSNFTLFFSPFRSYLSLSFSLPFLILASYFLFSFSSFFLHFFLFFYFGFVFHDSFF